MLQVTFIVGPDFLCELLPPINQLIIGIQNKS
jgi:hypothetical protein